MNLRQRKRNIYASMLQGTIFFMKWFDHYNETGIQFITELELKPVGFTDEVIDSFLGLRTGDRVEHTPDNIWRVARVKDNVVVLEAKSQIEAIEAIEKAARQKKAKLVLLAGEPYVNPNETHAG